MKIAVLTDSGCNLTQNKIEQFENLFVVPLGIDIDGELYRDQVDISSDEIYNILDDKKVKTSSPVLSDIENVIYNIIEKEYDHVIVINISSNLSGTFNAFRLVIEEIKEDNTSIAFTHYDSKTLCIAQGYLVLEALELINQQTPMDEIEIKLDELRYKESFGAYTVSTLHYLREGGRIGKVEGVIAEALHVKPIITVNDDGIYKTLTIAKGYKRAINKLIASVKKHFDDALVDLTVLYGNDLQEGTNVLEKLKNALNISKGEILQLSPVLGIHTGPNIIAVIARKASKKVID